MISHYAKHHGTIFISEPRGVLFQNADSQVASDPEILNSVGLTWGQEIYYFIKLHGDSEVLYQLKTLILTKTTAYR